MAVLAPIKNILGKGGVEERKRILEFIENNAKKADFINWLNTQHRKTYTEEDDWEKIEREITFGKDISVADLQAFEASLSSGKDAETLLEEVEEKTEEVERTAEKFFFLSASKKFSVAIGGASIMIGLLYALFGVAVFLQLFDFGLTQQLKTFTLAGTGLLGLVSLLAGLLLVIR